MSAWLTIRLPGAASEGDPAVMATDVSNAEFTGFRIVGDAATPLKYRCSSGAVRCRLWTNQRRPRRGHRPQSKWREEV